MALLLFDGFDHYGTGGNPATLGKWGASGSSPTAQTAPVRTGTHSLRTNAAGFLASKEFGPASTGCVVGFAIHNSAGTFTTTNFLEIREGATVHLALALSAGAAVVLKRGATVIATGTTVLSVNSWYYIEIKAVIHDTTGSYEVRIDGVTEAALTNAGPTDTRNVGATGQWGNILLGSFSTVLTTFFDDVYVCDTSGAAPRNTFLGPVKVETLYPQTDAVAAGSNAGLTPSTGTDHGALVDEATPNITDYNSSPTVGVKDTYNYPALTLTGAILGVQTNLYVQKSDAVARQVCAVVRSGSTDYDGANVSPLTTFAYFSEVRPLNPNTGLAWTAADIAALQVGMKVTL